ncbi:hypothetical protein ACTJKN_02625 [Pedobacter sp. 22163]|uniref:hypothetical protein n=1 Tax=Pedobacter sp. 22163 TaxID=3453883 RepID=UPI003F867531
MDLRKKMRSERELNPFNDKFDESKVMKVLADLTGSKKLEQEGLGIFLTAFSSIQMHGFYVEIYDVLKKRILNSGTDTNILSERLITLTNRHYQIIMEAAMKREIAAESHFEDSFKRKIPSADPSVGMIETAAAMETEIDALHISLNFISHFRGLPTSDPAKPDISYVEDCRSISKWSSILFVVKHCYDDCVWNNGQMVFSKDSGEFRITFDEPRNLLLNKAGFYRLLRNSQAVYYMLKQWHQKTTKVERGDVFFEERKKNVQIASVAHTAGYVSYLLESGEDNEETDFEIHNKAGLEAYYNYIDNVSLPKMPTLTLNDLVCMLSLVQHLFRKAAQNCFRSDVMKRADFDNFPVKIKRQMLKEYLLERTTYKSDQVDSFIDLLTNPQDKRINFWNYPFVASNEDLVFPLLTIIDPILLYLIDRWLEDAGYDLDKRGGYFEKYIKASIARILNKKKYFFYIPSSPKLYNKSGKYEEIDLLLNLRDIVVVGEVKCEKYPMEVRDGHNGLARLKHGSLQVIRKAAFILENADDLSAQIGEIKGKEIVKLVITNYPLYTGYELNGVAVVDYFLIESYLSSGRITGNAVTSENGFITTSETSEIVLQTSEDELNANFKSNMYSPKAVEEALKLVKLTTNKITPEGLNLQIYAQSAEYIA